MSGTQVRPGRSAGIPLYERAPEAAIDLSDNTNRWGTPPSALAALRDAAPGLAQYPEPYAESLKAAIAAYLGVGIENVSTGCGSDGVLDAAMRAFGAPGERVAIPEPTFPMPAAFALANALQPVPLALDGDCQPDAAAIAAVQPRIIYLCSPNNPLGAACGPERVADLARSTSALVIVDEAYAEFAGTTLVPLVRDYPNLLVTRTMSKAFGLAGARVGYAVGAPALIAALERVRGPFAVNAIGAAAATAALRNDLDWMRTHVALAVTERDYLAAGLRARGLSPLPSCSNFVLVPVRDSALLAERVRTRGVSVRAFSALRPVCADLAVTEGSALRITAGLGTEMDAVLAALDAALEGRTR